MIALRGALRDRQALGHLELGLMEKADGIPLGLGQIAGAQDLPDVAALAWEMDAGMPDACAVAVLKNQLAIFQTHPFAHVSCPALTYAWT